jgi:hypothetical protein
LNDFYNVCSETKTLTATQAKVPVPNSITSKDYQNKREGGNAPIVMALVEVLRARPDITEDVREWKNEFEDEESQDFPPGRPSFEKKGKRIQM